MFLSSNINTHSVNQTKAILKICFFLNPAKFFIKRVGLNARGFTCLLKLCLLMRILSVDMQVLKCDVQLMLDVIGADPTEAACEAECHKLIQEGHYLNYACPLVCLG